MPSYMFENVPGARIHTCMSTHEDPDEPTAIQLPTCENPQEI